MDEHDSHQEQTSHTTNPIPASAMAILSRITIQTLKSAGYEKVADMVANGPEKLGERLGNVIRKIAGKQERGEKITPEDEQTVEAAIAEEPISATAILGAALVTSLDNASSASGENLRILEGYKFVFELICEQLRARQTSIALAGFLQGSDCISYWHFGGTNAHFFIANEKLQSVSLDVYLIFREPTEEYLQELNETIRYDPQRRLPNKYFDYRKDNHVAHVYHIRDVEVTVHRLDPDPNKNSDPLGFGNFPMSFGYRISPGASPLVPMFESLSKALAFQDLYSSALNETVQSIKAHTSIP